MATGSNPGLVEAGRDTFPTVRGPYLYTSLPGSQAIRLLEVQTGQCLEPISCKLVLFEDYRQTPPYDALSYCWGSDEEVADVLCNEQTLRVTQSLLVALRRLQHPDCNNRHIWIDAICINQRDLNERGQQVSIMKQIYTAASRVLIWLGPSDEHSPKAMEAIRKMAKAHRMGVQGRIDDFWPVFRPILERPWFRRTWVIPEAQSCDNTWVMCGNESIEWYHVVLAAKAAFSRPSLMLPRRPTYDRYAVQQVLFIADRHMQTFSAVPFLEVLQRSRCFNASDPRDKVFALVQQDLVRMSGRETREPTNDYIANNDRHEESESSQFGLLANGHLGIVPDYSKTAHELYLDVAVKSILQTGTLEILSYYFRGQPSVAEIPPWVPHWDVDPTIWAVPLPTWHYNASFSMHTLSPFAEERLCLQGICIGKVSEVGWIVGTNAQQTCHTLKNGESLAVLSVSHLDGIARVLTHDRLLSETSSNIDNRGNQARRKDNPKQHFADFAAWLLLHCPRPNEAFYRSALNFFCNICEAKLADWSTGTPEPANVYSCGVCDGGNFDICVACYQEGAVCKSPQSHALRLGSHLSVRIYLDDADLERLREIARQGSAEQFYQVLRETAICRILFSTSRGDIGSGPLAMQEGDIVVVLFGARVPLVLRPCSVRKNVYRLIGDCYVDGVMDGSAVEMMRSGQIDKQIFDLC